MFQFGGKENDMWIARDKSGELFIYGHKPCKGIASWVGDTFDYSEVDCDVDLFPEVQWEDEEPTELIIKKVK